MTDYRDESTFSFDPSRIPVKQLDKESRTKKKLDGRKGVLLSSVTRKRKKSRRRRPLSQHRNQPELQPGQLQQHQQQHAPQDYGAAMETDPEPDVAASDALATQTGGATTSADDGDDSGSRSSTPCRKCESTSPPNPPAAPSPHPVTPPPQPEPPPVAGAATVAKSTAAADTLRPCALVASQGE